MVVPHLVLVQEVVGVIAVEAVGVVAVAAVGVVAVAAVIVDGVAVGAVAARPLVAVSHPEMRPKFLSVISLSTRKRTIFATTSSVTAISAMCTFPEIG